MDTNKLIETLNAVLFHYKEHLIDHAYEKKVKPETLCPCLTDTIAKAEAVLNEAKEEVKTVEKKKPSKIFYALRLTKAGASVSRYSLYEICTCNRQGNVPHLEVVWPKDSHKQNEEGEKATLLPNQTFWKRPEGGEDKYPAFHFKVGNVGYNKLEALRESLQTAYPDHEVAIELIQGWSPSSNSY